MIYLVSVRSNRGWLEFISMAKDEEEAIDKVLMELENNDSKVSFVVEEICSEFFAGTNGVRFIAGAA